MTPRQWQVAFIALLVVAVVIGYGVLGDLLPLPGLAASLPLVIVVAVGMAAGPTSGAVAGFATGLALDLVPPAAGILGVQALALLAAGTLAGRVRDPRGLAPVQVALITGGLAALAAGIIVALDWVFAPVGVAPTAVAGYVVSAAVLGMVAVPATSAVLRRSGPGPYRRPHRSRRSRPRVLR